MRFVGVALFLVGCGATGYCVREMARARRPRDLLLAIGAPAAAMVALTGLLLAFVPGFF